jgi:hypothetical protein
MHLRLALNFLHFLPDFGLGSALYALCPSFMKSNPGLQKQEKDEHK